MLDRRTFLAAAAAARWPAWLTRGLAQDPPSGRPEHARLADLRAAWARAARRGKPLLVFVVPSQTREAYARGQVLGALLVHADRATLLDLALCDLQCGTLTEVETVVGRKVATLSDDPVGRATSATPDRQAATPRRAEEPLLLLIEPPAEGTASSTSAAPILPLPSAELQALVTQTLQRPNLGAQDLGAQDLGTRDLGAREPGEGAAAPQIALKRLADAVHRALAADVGRLAARADRNRATLDEAERRELDRAFASVAGTPTSADLLLRAAAVVRMAALAPRRAGDQERLLAELEAAMRATYLRAPIGGSRWAKATGCGTHIEGPPLPSQAHALFGPCGTGFVPPLGRRFLHFVASDER
ncbi:MAG: hypothetical protein R3F56_07930 [Planctomycetota bacterium]